MNWNRLEVRDLQGVPKKVGFVFQAYSKVLNGCSSVDGNKILMDFRSINSKTC